MSVGLPISVIQIYRLPANTLEITLVLHMIRMLVGRNHITINKYKFSILEDDDNDDDENEDDADYEEVMVSRNLLSFMEEETFETRPTKRRSWDDEYVLKRQFSALIPAFDPRPGRTNINQTTGK